MRLVSILPESGETADPTGHRVAAVLPNGWLLPLVALARLAPDILAEEIDELELKRVVALDPSGAAIARALTVADRTAVAEEAIDPSSVRLAAPIPHPGKVVGVGHNYLEHVREQGLETPTRPVLFAKFANAVIPGGAPIRKPAGTHALDFEAELAVVVGRTARRVSATEGLACVAGFTCANDVTARDWQGQAAALRDGEKGDGQWLRAKGSDTFLPLGPFFATPAELDAVPGASRDGRGLAVRSWLTRATGPEAGREVQMQDGNTSDLLFGVGELISLISAEITLDPGDVVITGTPSGVGVFRTPPVFLEPGDVVRIEVAGLGSLTNPVVDDAGVAPAGSPAEILLRGERPAGAVRS
jgi:2-keto-4-pentenoate hydratase/2-oxohepta-3-ene-1,7-dioic acid hydratase in catechol pathway